MSELDPEVFAALDPNHEPLLGEKEPPTRHPVREHQRTLPPKPPAIDPDQLTIDLDDPRLPPQPRVVTVKPHVRRNPRRQKETHEMTDHDVAAAAAVAREAASRVREGQAETIRDAFDQIAAEVDAATCLPPETRTDVTAMKDAQAVTARPDLAGVASARGSDPATSHAAARAAQGSLRRRMIEVLRVFQDQDFAARGLGDEATGYTDDELVDRLARLDVTGSPSGFRTARKDLARLGLVSPVEATEDGLEYVTRPTRLGNDAVVYVLTDAGRDYVLPAP